MPWLRPGWAEAWWEAWGAGDLELHVLRDGGRLAALLPLARHRGALTGIANWHTPSFGILARDADAAAELARAVVARRPRRVALAFLLPERRGLAEVRDAAAAAGYRLIVRTVERSPHVDTRTGWEAYERSLGRKLLSELRRRRRRLEERGELRLEVLDGTDRLAELLEEGFGVEAAAWKGARGTAIASDPPTRRFYERIAGWFAGRGALRLAFLRLDERALAFDFAVEEDGVHYLLKTGYEPEFRNFAPGMLLRHEMIRRAFEDGLASYEFLGADEPWKLEWASTFRDLKVLQAFSPRPTGSVDWLAWAAGRPAAKRVLTLARR
ncbi:MAG TPA: GNAT family N-acetyltransferase [Gaiellaceae bacterium]|nr:GNAT family N-acetyltransferase [Gaiellaceae bacterium]